MFVFDALVDFLLELLFFKMSFSELMYETVREWLVNISGIKMLFFAHIFYSR